MLLFKSVIYNIRSFSKSVTELFFFVTRLHVLLRDADDNNDNI